MADRAHRDDPPQSSRWPVEDYVLLVDPDLELLDALRASFEADGYRVVLAMDGIEAVHRLGETSGLPVAIVAAEHMPWMSGLELDRFVRSDASLRSIVVIVTVDSTETELEAIAVKRPPRYEVLRRIIRQKRDTLRPPSSRRLPQTSHRA